mmetsp:Transcript_9882/g.14703  ORF Transcript_9882/g.14703 Transcript_9882/m.14703 type:complete len:317 (-) Transcript_9882:229-1179(-)|eukprot:CAMPEP_0196810040 /NCGR_PEP_ID=MMETSP1362-20130617/9883_1 /TAXON_ID=163516 /ORGANISM="Leptocylindrus danicus, Strain CCMP1856" /LENGTH=316 /DNA_ID=CAMNT_0042184903 /DNA_START=391 /DNA_END=1341 /DNA_ORIENTATION=-
MSGLHGHPVIPGMLPPLQQIVMPNPIDPAEAMLGVFPCAKVRGMPYLSSIEDVLVFFSGLVLIDVVFNREGSGATISQQQGHASGDTVEAFCVFGNHMDFQMALQRDRQMMGSRCVEVHQGKRSEYYEAIASCQSKVQHGRTNRDGIVEVTGELQNMNISPWNVHLNVPTPAPIGAPSQQQKQHNTRGNRSNNQRGSTGQLPSTSSSRGGHTHTRGGIQEGDHTGILRMRGLPFSATDGDIMQFFEEYKLVKESVVFTFRNDGRPSGEAYVKFQSAEDSKRAMSLNRQSMGSRYIELFIASEDEHSRSVARLKNIR